MAGELLASQKQKDCAAVIYNERYLPDTGFGVANGGRHPRAAESKGKKKKIYFFCSLKMFIY